MKQERPDTGDRPKGEEMIAWRPPEDCCDTPAGKQTPTIDLSVSMNAATGALAISLDLSHPCGLRFFSLEVQLLGANGRWVFYEDHRLPGNDNQLWSRRWGPEEDHQLPEPIGDGFDVTVIASSVCGTVTNVNREVRRY